MMLTLPLICKVVDNRCTTVYQRLICALLSYWPFYTDRPSRLSSDPDIVPTVLVFEFSRRTKASDRQKLPRHERLLKRRTTTNVRVNDRSTSAHQRKESVGAKGPNVSDIDVNTDTILTADKVSSFHQQLEDKAVNIDDGFQTQQVLVRWIEETREEVKRFISNNRICNRRRSSWRLKVLYND